MTACDFVLCARYFAAAACECGSTYARCDLHQGGLDAARAWRDAHRSACSNRSGLWKIEPRSGDDKDLVATSVESDWSTHWQGTCWCGEHDRLLVGGLRVRYSAANCHDHEYQDTWIFTRCGAGHLLDLPFWIWRAHWCTEVHEAYGFSPDWRPRITRDPHRITAAEAVLLGGPLSLALELLAEDETAQRVHVPTGVSLFTFVTGAPCATRTRMTPTATAADEPEPRS